VDIGSAVALGDTLLIVEAMKTLNQIPSTRAGTVTQILFEDGQPVEYGESLMIVEWRWRWRDDRQNPYREPRRGSPGRWCLARTPASRTRRRRSRLRSRSGFRCWSRRRQAAAGAA